MVTIERLPSYDSNDENAGASPNRQCEEQDCDDDHDNVATKPLCCTYSVTGNRPTFQAIFICHECCNVNKKQEGEEDNGVDENDVNNEEPQPLCICQACSEACHADHDVEYIGMGPCYCDCDQVGQCTILTKSNDEADRLGVYPKNLKEQQATMDGTHAVGDDTQNDAQGHQPHRPSNDGSCIQDVYDIPALSRPITRVSDRSSRSTTSDMPYNAGGHVTMTDLLIDQARELIRHSKETHWVDETMVSETSIDAHDVDSTKVTDLCLSERLALSIFQRHVMRYNLSSRSDGAPHGGAEWWVQVKPATSLTNATRNSNDGTRQDQAIDLHYDKDEALAESFGIGSFPTLSTVTYLTTGMDIAYRSDNKDCGGGAGNIVQNPTLIFPHTYDQGEEELMPSMLLSRPIAGKHVVFDGRLLHGAPSHASLLVSERTKSHQQDSKKQPQPQADKKVQGASDDDDNPLPSQMQSIPREGALSKDENTKRTKHESYSYRVTFLVNIWMDRRPANVKPLESSTRQALQDQQKEVDGISLDMPSDWLVDAPSERGGHENAPVLTMTQRPITSVTLNTEDDLPSPYQERIELPFVCKGITWDEDEYLDSPGLVLTTFPPPASTDDTLMVNFGPGMQAYLEYLEQEDQDEQKFESSASKGRPNECSDYRDLIQDYYV